MAVAVTVAVAAAAQNDVTLTASKGAILKMQFDDAAGAHHVVHHAYKNDRSCDTRP